jgi:hypothetical protein
LGRSGHDIQKSSPQNLSAIISGQFYMGAFVLARISRGNSRIVSHPHRTDTPKVYRMKKKAIAPMASIPGLNRIYIVFSPGEIE